MATYADSAIDYNWEITNLDVAGGIMTVKYSVADSADSDRIDAYQRFNITSDNFDSASLISLIENAARAVVIRWDQNLEKEQQADSASFNGPALIGLTGSDRYKPFVAGTPLEPFTDYNPLVSKPRYTDSEGPDGIYRVYSTSPLDSDEKVQVHSSMSVDIRSLFRNIRTNAAAVGAFGMRSTTGSHIRTQASWDGSSAGSFSWSTDKIDDFGVDSVSRQSEGTFRVHFAEQMPDSNYTVTTGIGAENYGGAGASPRQLTITERTPSYVEVHCERTDDAVDEDNAYFSVMVSGGYGDATEIASFGEVTDKMIDTLFTKNSVSFGDSVGSEVQSALGYNDSDWAQYLYDIGGSGEYIDATSY